MDHYNIFRLCKAVYGYIQVTTDKMKKDNLIRYQIIDLSITKNAVDTLYKDVKKKKKRIFHFIVIKSNPI